MELLGGKIHVESDPGQGSTFRFFIPWIQGEPVPQPFRDADIQVSKPSGRNLKILIVEDDDASGMFLQISLKKLYSEVSLADNGPEAIRICREQKPDLILLDLKMPLMNGFEVAKQIREFDSDVIIIAQSAFAFYSDRELAMDAGCNDFLVKPILIHDLLAMIARYCS